MFRLLRLLTIIISTITLVGCSNNDINHQIYQEGEKYANQIYQIKYGIIDLDNKGLEKFLKQDKSNLNGKEKQYIKLIEDFYIQWTIYIADKTADGKVNKETKDKFMKISNKLKNEYDVNLKER